MNVRKIKKPLMYLFLIVASFVSIFPFIWMMISSTNKSVEVTRGSLTLGSNLLVNYRNLVSNTNFWQVFGNSAFVAIITTVLGIIASSLAGYGFELYRSKSRDRVFSIILMSMMVPFAALMIPLYRLISQMGLINNYLAIILPGISTAFLIFFFRQNSKMFPKEIIEAARIDGLGEVRIFFSIYMPVMKSAYSAAGIITFMSTWNNFLWPLIVLQSPNKMTLPILISSLGSAYTPDFGVIMLSIVISTLPTGVLFFLMQKNFVQGMLGSVK
ncbi:carbohydrate ABC transporter permease [Proteiniclasticum ruminis]|uniref:carbohydrate ABC transporter permease n=1 Tax=Proteiniclasticum ruminis TaxID=398199 RepID=UPI0035E3EAE4